MSQLLDLSRPFPNRVIHDNPSGYGSYVAHHLYVQRLLMHLGPYSFELVEVVRGSAPGKRDKKDDPEPSPLLSVIVGVVMRLTVEIDGMVVRIEEVGDCESPSNWPHDGARLKDAMSDSLKRCCARIGLGTHLYSKGDEYVLFAKLKEQVAEPDEREIVATADVTLLEDDPGRPFQ
jgi:hypothetical protein